MGVIIFLLLSIICIGSIYIVHKYFDKNEFYFITIIFCIVSFLMSFKLIKVFGIEINPSIIFGSGIIAILYYFVNKYNVKELKKIKRIIFISIITLELFMVSSAFMIPSIYDVIGSNYDSLVFDNIPIIILYPISLFITLYLGGYCFEEFKHVEKNKYIKLLLIIVGIIFIDTFIFIYFSYAFLIKFDSSIMITLGNYLVKTIITFIFIILINKIIKVKKVK